MRGLLQLALDFLGGAPVAPSRVKKSPNSKRKVPMASVDVDKFATENVVKSSSSARHFQHPHANRAVQFGVTHVGYRLTRARRRSIGFVVGPEGLDVRAPNRVPLYEIDSALQEKASWIVRKLIEVQQRQSALASSRMAWHNGVVLPFLGAPVQVVLGTHYARGAALVDAVNPPPDAPALLLQVGLPEDATPAQIGSVVQAWLLRQATCIFEERLHHYAPQLGVQWRRLGLSNANTRWGSASSGGNIRLNWRLVHLRQPVLDYVVVHELAHLRVMDHSPRFWATVGTVMPDYAALRAELKAAAVPRWD